MLGWHTFWLAFALAAAPLETLPPQGDRPFDLGFPDQFGQRRSVADCWGDLLVLVYGDKSVETATRQLRDRLEVPFHRGSHGGGEATVKPVAGAPPGVRSPDVRVAAVACIRGVPTNMQFIMQRHFAAVSPHGLVLLDFQERMQSAFGLTPGACQVVVFDTHGRLRLRTAGEFDQESFAKLAEAIEALRLEAVECIGQKRMQRRNILIPASAASVPPREEPARRC